MNKEIISAMLSADTPSPVNGEGRGGRPYFTKQDAMFCVSGMNKNAWNYMQCVDLMVDDTFEETSLYCALRMVRIDAKVAKQSRRVRKIAEIALIESRQAPFSHSERCRRMKISRKVYYDKWICNYADALDIYNRLDNQATEHIKKKLGHFNNN